MSPFGEFHIYYRGTLTVAGDIINGYPQYVPEPTTMALLAVGAMTRRAPPGTWRRRKGTAMTPRTRLLETARGRRIIDVREELADL